MALHDELKNKLRLAVALNRKTISERNLETAVLEIEKKKKLTKSDIQFIGESVAGDREIFAAVELDDINNLIGRLGDK